MCLLQLNSQRLALLVFAVLCAFAGSLGAEEGPYWPVYQRLMTIDDDALEPWAEVGEVAIWNTKDDLKIAVRPDGYLIKELNVHVVQDPAEFQAVLNKKGHPIAGYFDYKNDFMDLGEPVPYHEQIVSLSNFEICWSVRPEKCPPNLFIAVHAELTGLSQRAIADGDGTFDRLDKDDGSIWGWYVVYPLAKVEPGHFIDANVNGLGYSTITQFGTTGQNGQFWFLPDEHVAFSVGNLFLGEAFADRRVWPADLFEGADMYDDRTLNVARLLQSFDADGMQDRGSINITDTVVGCLNSVLGGYPALPAPDVFFADDYAVGEIIDATIAACDGLVDLTAVTKEQALENLNSGLKAGNLMKRDISKTPAMKSDKAKIEIMPVYVPALRSNGLPTSVVYHDEYDEIIEERNVAKPIVITYLDEVEDTGAYDVFLAVSRDDGDTWKRRNLSKTAGKSSLLGYPGESWKPMLKVKDNMIFVAWTDKYCRGGRPGHAIKVCPDTTGDGLPDPCEFCRETDEGTFCTIDYPGDDAYWQDDIFGVAGPQRSVIYEDFPEMGEVPYSCVWTSRAMIDPFTGDIQWFKPERVSSGRRDAYQLFAGAGTDVAFAIVWQEDPKGLRPGEGEGPGEGWSGARSNNKTDIWYSYIKLSDFGKVDYSYPVGGHGENDDMVDLDPELMGRVKALVPMSLPVRISDNDVCSMENMDPDGGHGEHDYHDSEVPQPMMCDLDGDRDIDRLDISAIVTLRGTTVPPSDPLADVDADGIISIGDVRGCVLACTRESCAVEVGPLLFNPEGLGTHRYCGTLEGIGTAAAPGTNRLCAYTVEKTNPNGDIHNVCVTADGRFLDGNTGASRANIFLQPYKKPDGTKSAWAIVGYEESKGVGIPPDHDDHDCDTDSEDEHDTKYKPDEGKNVIYHSFDFMNPELVSGGGILNLPETDAAGNPVYLVDEFGDLLLDWKGDPQLAYENARRVRFVSQPKSKAGDSKTVLVALYRQGEEGKGKPADVFMRRAEAWSPGNPYAFSNFVPGAQNVSSVTPTVTWQNPFDLEKPEKMLRWAWTPDNLADKSATNPRIDAKAQRGALIGDDLLIGYSWTPNWGRKANDKYDFYVRRSFNGGRSWTTDPAGSDIEHNVVFRVPVEDYDTQTITWDEEVVTTVYGPGALEPPRNVSNLRNNRTSVLEPRLVKTPGTIKDAFGYPTGYPEDVQNSAIYQLAFGLEFNQNQLPDDVVYPKLPLDIYYSRTKDKGQRYESVVVTPQGGGGKPQDGWNMLAKDKPEQGAAQLRQTPDGSRMYGIWLEESEQGSDIMFRRVDYRGVSD